MEADYKLIDNEERHQYEFHVDQYTPKIEYIKSTNGEIYLTHTEVPEKYEGQGIGAELVRAVLEDVRAKKVQIIPQCPFIAQYIYRHPEWADVVLKEVPARKE